MGYKNRLFGTLSHSAGGVSFSATGGVKTTSGAYTIHTFTTGGNFITTGSSKNIEYLVVAGGGGGCGDLSGSSAIAPYASGGAGGLLTNVGTPTSLPIGTYPVIVGAGGQAGALGTNGTNGTNSSFNGVITYGGGGGGFADKYYGASGLAGGSGGGAGIGKYTGGSPGAGTPGQGFAGSGSQGGGAGGSNGAGVYNSISGTSTYYASGGDQYAITAPTYYGQGGNANLGAVVYGKQGIVIIRYLT